MVVSLRFAQLEIVTGEGSLRGGEEKGRLVRKIDAREEEYRSPGKSDRNSIWASMKWL